MSESGFSKEAYFYHSPIIFMGIFYLVLLVWTGICLLLMGSIGVQLWMASGKNDHDRLCDGLYLVLFAGDLI